MAPALVVRPATDADRAFLRALYGSTRVEELAPLGWGDAEREAFLDQQFDARERAWAAQRPAGVRHVVEVDGTPAGRLDLDRSGPGLHVVDLALLPDHRGRGTGTRLLAGVLAEADAAGTAVTIYVERGNRARVLYERLGFGVVRSTGVYDLLERPASG